MPKVSICSSVLNHSDWLKEMIQSVVDQTFEDWELMIVDDGSTEDLKSVVDSFNDKRIRLWTYDSNRGIPHGINLAFQSTTGEYVQPIAVDEIIHPGKLAWQVEYLDSNKKVDCVWGLPQNGPMGERPEWEQYSLRAQNRSREQWVKTLLNLEQTPIGGVSSLWRRSVFDSIGYFDPKIVQCSDLEWFVRFFKKHDGFVSNHRWHQCKDNPDSVSRATEANIQRFYGELAYVKGKHQIEPPKMGKVTVAIPCFNMERYLDKAIWSILEQTYQDFQLFILDDASTDGTADCMKCYTDSRIHFFQFDENRGPEAAVNQMLARCETEFFTVMSADDLVEKTYLERVLAEFEKNPWLEMVSSQTDFIDELGNPHVGIHPFKQIEKAANKSRMDWLARLYYGNVYFGVGTYRTQTAKDLGGWSTEVGCLGDYDMYLKLLQRENIHVIEEPLTHTRIRADNRSILSVAQQKDLWKDYYKIKSRFYAPRLKVIIATPFYEMRGFSPYIESMVQTIRVLTTMGIEHDFWQVSGDSYVDRAKNTIFNKFLEHPENTHLFMIDSDMQWDAAAFVKMLMLPEGIVAGSYPQKNAWGKWTSIPKLETDEDGTQHPVGHALGDGSALVIADALSGGFLRIRREVLERYKEKYSDYTYMDSSADPNDPERVYTEFFTCERKDGLRWGEDRVFGNRLKEMGEQVWIYPNATFGHYGVKGWIGNFHNFMQGQGEAQEGTTRRIS